MTVVIKVALLTLVGVWKVAKVAGVELGNSLLQPFIGKGRASFLQPSQGRGTALNPSSALMNTDLFELYRNAFYVLKNNRINQKENFAILYNLEGQLTCLGTNSQYPVSALIQEIYSLITGNDDIAIQTDLVIVKSESQNRTTIFCQVSSPSLAAVPQDQCETMMETVHRQFTDIFDECTDNLCFMTINREGWSALTPEKLACQTPRNSNKGQIKQITDNLSNIRQNSLVLNRALGTGLYANLEGNFLRCNIDMNKSFYHIENANIEQCKYQNISPDETVERKELEDFKISVLTNALDKHRTNRQKRMALVNLGGEESEDLSAALQTINENFEKIKISYRELYEQNLRS